MERRTPTFRCITHITPHREPPPDELFVFEPDAHDINTLTGGVVGDVVAGRHMTFVLAAFGREYVTDDEVPLMDVIWDLPRLTDAFDAGEPGEIDLVFHNQGGLILTLHFVMAGDDVIVTGKNPSRELIPWRVTPPPERLRRADLASELRQVARDVLTVGAHIGSELVTHPMVTAWAERVKVLTTDNV